MSESEKEEEANIDDSSKKSWVIDGVSIIGRESMVYFEKRAIRIDFFFF